MPDVLSELRRLVTLHGSELQAATALGLNEDAVNRVLKGRGLNGKNLAAFRKALKLPPDAPLRQSAATRGTNEVREPAPIYVSGDDPITALVREGQAEQAAWVLEFAAKILEAGAKRLREADRQLHPEQVKAAEQDAEEHMKRRGRSKKTSKTRSRRSAGQ